MNLHSLTSTPGSTHRRKRLGRGHGSGMGKTSGKGHKGQRARTGHKRKPTFEGGQIRLVQRVPIRGFTNYTRQAYLGVNVFQLDKLDDGSEMTIEALRASALVRGPKDTKVKILGSGELTKKLTVHAHKFSASAQAKIEAAGGTCVIAK